MNGNLQEDVRRAAERASEWLEVLEDNPGARERAAFAAWIAESPLHVREFLNIAAVDRLLENADPQRRVPIETVQRESPTNVLPLAGRQRESAVAPARRALWMASAAVLLLAVGVIVWWQQNRAWREYSTSVGEQSTFELADRTAVNLNTRTRLQVRFTAQAREVRLLEGEALFTVRPDPSRPFRVRAGSNVIQAIGTAFNVYRHPSGKTTVSVIEGKVQISNGRDITVKETPRLSAGEEAHIEVGGQIARREKVDTDTVTAWRERRLVFHRVTLEEIAAEFNRYNDSPRISVENSALSQRRYTVVLPADDPESLLDYLRNDPDVAFETHGGDVRIYSVNPR